ncbi:MAG: amidase family protein, partial [Leptothrix sp. (in: b-proteobacteria)]
MTDADFPIDDTVGAWVPHGRFVLPGAPSGPLAGLRFAAKDLFDVAGQTTGAGNPTWLATHAPATRHAALVSQLLDAGASLAGKVLTDELAYSLHGDNAHHGAPINAASPERVTGGSSSGSAAAVAARLVDFALATDTGGSTRVPASYCGLWGLRTTHDLLPRDGLVALSRGFDTPNWLAHDAEVFERVGAVLLPPVALPSDRAPTTFTVWTDAWA